MKLKELIEQAAPLPLRIQGVNNLHCPRIVNANARPVALMADDTIVMERSAALIVHAVNVLPQLVKALEVALNYAPKCNPQHPSLLNDQERCPEDHPYRCGACAAFYTIKNALESATNVKEAKDVPAKV